MNECCCKSKFWIGMGLGAIVGAVCCHLVHTEQGKEMRIKLNEAIHRAGDKAQSMWQSVKGKTNSSDGECCKECEG